MSYLLQVNLLAYPNNVGFPSCTCQNELPVCVFEVSEYRMNLPEGLGKYKIGGFISIFLMSVNNF